MSRDTLHYTVIQSFADHRTEALFIVGFAPRIAPDLAGRARRKLDMLHRARSLRDLRLPTSNRLHTLRGDRKGQFAIAVNGQWRICFRFEDGDAFDVEFCDYH